MKVVYVLHLTNEYDGSTKAFINMLSGVIKLGVEPLVIIPDNQGITMKLHEMNVKTLTLNYKYCTYPKLKNSVDFVLFIPKMILRLTINEIAAHRLSREAKKFGAEIIHTNVSVLDVGFKAAKKMQIPHILHIREYCEESLGLHFYPSRNSFLKRLKKENSYSICVTKAIAKYDEVDELKNARVIYDGILPKETTKISADKENHFLYVGTIREDKGIFDLIHSYSRYCELSKNVLPLYVVGSADDERQQNHLVETIKKLQLEQKVKLFGHRSDVFELMSKAAAVIVPSRSEGFGFVPVEAMSVGSLVVGKNVAGIKEQFDNGKEMTGEEIALRYENNNELTNRLIEVSDNGIEKYFDITKRAQQVVNKLYSHDRNSELVFEFYKEILNNQ